MGESDLSRAEREMVTNHYVDNRKRTVTAEGNQRTAIGGGTGDSRRGKTGVSCIYSEDQ